ncbi:hypothetical protein ABI_08720 [Asticcacaulis biprosthecium C19]|uniref:Uncharacterized protein n=1 Tax=Asticcacaulis biprosthecium C19 TaxID=715226 RepID=F4QGA8_9CAUL|nr:hypothetical protein [Asticcacaulis biprosthecium]EGF92436.1 hypothetical protein ABI_08720 [Asticcacaulis biprosthecium C19]
MTPPEAMIEIRRGTTAPTVFRFKSNVNGGLLDLEGSTFSLILTNELGVTVLAKAGVIETTTVDGLVTDCLVKFALTKVEKAALKAGKNGRFEVRRVTEDAAEETWIAGNTNIRGVA